MDGNYYLGLDMGTSSCGWSVTDEEYHVLRRHGKALWGVRLFEGAKTAEERRMHRAGRRRLDRRGWRINILQELFAEEVSKIDPGFFLRMKESKYYPEDKRDINGERPELMKDRKLLNPIILINKIKIDTLFKVDGFYMWLSGRTGKQLIFKGANELLLSDEETKILKKVIKFINRKIENKNVKIVAFDGINEAELTHLYDVFVSKLQNTIYKIRLGLQASTLIDNKGKFEKLSLEDKCTVLAEILHLFQCRSTMANLTLISGPAKAGSIKINNNITKCKQISIINQSVTGIYEKEIDLLKL